MVAVDTNVLVRLLSKDDPKQYKLARLAVEDGAWISHVVLAETMWVLSRVYECEPKWLIQAIAMLTQHEYLVLEDTEVVLDALAMFKTKPKLGFSDCLVLAVAKAAGCTPLMTFDKGLAKLTGAELIHA